MSESEIPFALNKLLRMLHLRKGTGAGAYHLLLTSSISLTPEVLERICNSRNWWTFRQYLRDLSPNERIHLLASHLDQQAHQAGYRALALLIQAGYFSTILTTNLDSTLEEALSKVGVPQNEMRVMIVERDRPDYIAASLDSQARQINIIKLHGSLNEGVLAKGFPDVFLLPKKIEESMARYFAQDMVVVGSLEKDDDILRFLRVPQGNAIYYTLPEQPSREDDLMIRLLESCEDYVSPDTYMIAGPYGNFTTFFQTLHDSLGLAKVATFHITVEHSRRGTPEPSLLRSASPEKPGLPEPLPVVDVLLVTVTERETSAVLEQAKNTPRLCFIRKRAYTDLGLIGNARVFLTQSEMNAGGPGGARNTVSEGIQALSPAAVIMVGIACGLKPEQQQIGDILVSDKLTAYEQQRIGTDQRGGAPSIRMSGYRVPASPSMLSRFRHGRSHICFATWPRSQAPRVFFGLILSGDKLFDNQAALAHLRAQEPKAIGLEMEGTGLYDAAANSNVDWLLVKAISDWGDGKKKEGEEQCQKLAAENAARFTLEIIAQGGFVREDS